MLISTNILVYLYIFLLPAPTYGKGWYLDASCDPYRELVKKGMKQAFITAETALEVIGSEPEPGHSGKWRFPEKETRDLSARVFGTNLDVEFTKAWSAGAKEMVNKYKVVRDTFGWILETYKNQNDDPRNIPDDPNPQAGFGWHMNRRLRQGDMLLYCDLARFTWDGQEWRNPENNNEAPVGPISFQNCQRVDPNTGDYTSGFASIPHGGFAPIQICPGMTNSALERYSKLEHQTFDDVKTVLTMSRLNDALDKIWDVCTRSKADASQDNTLPVNLYKLFEHTLLHEMTHTVPFQAIDPQFESNNVNKKYIYRRYTDDHKTSSPDPLSRKGYRWGGVSLQRDSNGWYNADSYVFYGIGARMLKEKNVRVRLNGCLEKVGLLWKYKDEIAKGKREYVENGWEMPKFKRALEFSKPSLKDLKLPRSWNSLAPYPMVRRNVSTAIPTGFITTGTGTPWSSLFSQPSTSISNVLANNTSRTSPSSLTARSTSQNSTSISSVAWTISSESKLSSESTTSINGRLPNTTSSFFSGSMLLSGSSDSPISASPSTLSLFLPSNISQSLSNDMFTTSNTNIISGRSSSGAFITTMPTSMPTPTSNASIPLSATLQTTPTMSTAISSSISYRGIDELLSSFWSGMPTGVATPTNVADLFCTDASLIGCLLPTAFKLEKLITATHVDIPKITDISIFPHIDVEGVDVVKVKLPESVCKPIPKPRGGGFLGGVFKVASNLVNGVIDAACNVELPVVKKGKIPKWFNFQKFPHPTNFPPPPGGKPKEPHDPEESKPTRTPEPSTAKSSRSSSCSQTAFSSCDVSRFVSDSVTRTTQSCTTTSGCTGKDITMVTATTWICSQSLIQDCQGTAFVSGSGTTFFATKCSTRSACSGAGTTSITTMTSSSVGPEMTAFVEPTSDEEEKHRECALKLADSSTDTIKESDYLACFGLSPSSPENSTSTSFSMSTNAPRSSFISGPSSFVSTTKSANETSSTQTTSSNNSNSPEATTSSSSTLIVTGSSLQSSASLEPTPSGTPLDDCKKKIGECLCKSNICPIIPDATSDCYTVKAVNCDKDCKGCRYPPIGTPVAPSPESKPPVTPSSTAPPCTNARPMDDCKKKKSKCFCKTSGCLLTPDPSYDCYDVEAVDCDDSCKGCKYPLPGRC